MNPVQVAEQTLGRSLSPGAMAMLTDELNIRLRVRQMHKTFTTPAAAVIPLPVDFVEAVEVTLEGAPQIPVTTSNLADGTFAIVAGDLRMTAEDGDVRMIYVAQLSPLTHPDDTNAVLATYPSLYLYGLLRHHATLTRDDDGRQHWDALFEGALDAAHKADVRARQSEIAMRPIPAYRA